jgi:hypothetical protein
LFELEPPSPAVSARPIFVFLTLVKNLYANEQTAKGSDRENDDRPDVVATRQRQVLLTI